MSINNKYLINFHIVDLCLSGSPENFNSFEFAHLLKGSCNRCNCSGSTDVAVEVQTTSPEEQEISIDFDNDVKIEILQQSSDGDGNVRLQ